MPSTPNLLTLAEVARLTGRHRGTLRRWVAGWTDARGIAHPPVIPARLIDGIWYVNSNLIPLIQALPQKPWKAKS